MKAGAAILVAFLAVSVSGTTLDLAPKVMLEAVINDYIDRIFANLPSFIHKTGLDPLKVIDIDHSFQVKPIFVTYYGNLNISDIWTSGLAQLHRNGDAILRYEARMLHVRINIIAENLDIKGKYAVGLQDLLKHNGGLEGTLKNMELYVDIAIDMKDFEVFLQDFSTPSSGDININLTGTPLLDWLLNVVLDLANKLLHETVVQIVGGEIQYIIKEMINMMNNREFVQLLQMISTV